VSFVRFHRYMRLSLTRLSKAGITRDGPLKRVPPASGEIQGRSQSTQSASYDEHFSYGHARPLYVRGNPCIAYPMLFGLTRPCAGIERPRLERPPPLRAPASRFRTGLIGTRERPTAVNSAPNRNI